MKRLILIALIFLSLPALADHHRAQAVVLLEQAQSNANYAIIHFNAYATSGPLTPFQVVELNSFNTSFNAMNVFIEDALNELRFSCGDLDIARRFLNQQQLNSNPTSATWRNMQALKYVGVFAGVWPNEVATYKNAIAQMIAVQMNLDSALWHIQDAIREEVYNDPDFQ